MKSLNSFRKNLSQNFRNNVIDFIKINFKLYRTNENLIRSRKHLFDKSHPNKINVKLDEDNKIKKSVNPYKRNILIGPIKQKALNTTVEKDSFTKNLFYLLNIFKDANTSSKKSFTILILSFFKSFTRMFKAGFNGFWSFFENFFTLIANYFKHFSLIRTLFFIFVFFAYFGTPHNILSKYYVNIYF